MIHSPKITGAGSWAWMVITWTEVMVASLMTALGSVDHRSPLRTGAAGPGTLGHEATIDGEIGAGHEAGAVAGQVQRGLGDVLRQPQAAQGMERTVLAEGLVEVAALRACRRPDQVGVDGAGTDGVHP